MENAKERLRELQEEVVHFTFKNFAAEWSEYGYPASLSSQWVNWTTRVRVLIESLFPEKSAPRELLQDALSEPLLGYEERNFVSARGKYRSALVSAIAALDESPPGEHPTPLTFSSRVFIVHGHDERAKDDLERLVRDFGLDPIVLHRQPDKGRTIIEKFEEHSDVGFAFVLLTPDDIACPAQDWDQVPVEKLDWERRARQNVVLEFGYFLAKLGRDRVCCLYTGDVTLPSDASGILYTKYRDQVEEAGVKIARELKAAGYAVMI